MANPDSVLFAALDAAVLLLVVAYATYVGLIVVPFLRRRPSPPGDAASFEWHFLVPCLNEEAVVEQTVRRLVSQFPVADVWCIDDASTDATPLLLASLASEFPRVRCVTRRQPDAQNGKGPALNAGWEAIVRQRSPDGDTSRVIVGVVDADGRLDPRCLDAIAGRSLFGDESVGAVQIKVRVVNRKPPGVEGRLRRFCEELLVKLQDCEFTCVIASQQNVRRRFGSAGLGGNGQFTRLSALDAVADRDGVPWHSSLIEDFELGVHVLLEGYRTEYCHETWVEQEGLTSIGALIRQRSRWGQGNMQCFGYLPSILRSQHISTVGAIEISYFIAIPWVLLVGSAVFSVAGAVLCYRIAQGEAGAPLPLIVLIGFAPLLAWGPIYRRTTDHSLSRVRAVVLGVAYWPYTLVAYAAAWRAFARLLGSRNDWAKTERLATGPDRPDGTAVIRAPAASALTRSQRNVGRAAVGSARDRPSRPATRLGGMEQAEALTRLGLDAEATRADIDRVWRIVMKVLHPDTGSAPDDAMTVILSEARAVALNGLAAPHRS